MSASKQFFCAKVETIEQFEAYCDHFPNMYRARLDAEAALTPTKPNTLQISGYCAVCEQPSRFLLDWLYSDGVLPRYRERLICEKCNLNGRMRATLEFIRDIANLGAYSSIYAMEQVTPLYRALVKRHHNVVGSEYLRDGTERGQTNAKGLRHEDVTALSFVDKSFDGVISLEVFEHVPDYVAALKETHRVLKHGGQFIFTAPFVLQSRNTLVRASIVDGEIVHHESPEYHGDPVSNDGALCFYHFGWDLLQKMRETGFREAALYFYWSRAKVYLGGFQFIIMATK